MNKGFVLSSSSAEALTFENSEFIGIQKFCKFEVKNKYKTLKNTQGQMRTTPTKFAVDIENKAETIFYFLETTRIGDTQRIRRC